VQITGINACAVERAAPPVGPLVAYPRAGETRVIAVEFELDQARPQAQSEGSPYFHDDTLSLVYRKYKICAFRIREEGCSSMGVSGPPPVGPSGVSCSLKAEGLHHRRQSSDLGCWGPRTSRRGL
jgi:hypothetical protein